MNAITQFAECRKPFLADLDEAGWIFKWPVESFCHLGKGGALFTGLLADGDDEVKVLPVKLG